LSEDELRDLLLYKAEDWEPGPSEKADRFVLINRIMSTWQDKNKSLIAKAGAVILLIAQYYYKRLHHGRVQDALGLKGVEEVIANALQAKFILLNKDQLIQFKDRVHNECREMAKLMNMEQ